jgi:hypothetical protein
MRYHYEGGNTYEGDDEFAGQLKSALATLQSKETGAALVQDIVDNKNTVQMFRSTDDNFAADDGSEIHWNPNNTNSGVDQNGNSSTKSFINLGHEMAHIQDAQNGTFDRSEWKFNEGLKNAEKYAGKIENKIRVEHGEPLRKYYVGISNLNLKQIYLRRPLNIDVIFKVLSARLPTNN